MKDTKTDVGPRGPEPRLASPSTSQGQGSESQLVAVTRNEAEYLTKRYLDEIADIDLEWELFGSTGSCNRRAKAYANSRINAFAQSGMIDIARVKELANEAFAILNAHLGAREERLQRIVAWLGAVVENGRGKLGDVWFELGGEGYGPAGSFFITAKQPGGTRCEKFDGVGAAVQWLKGLTSNRKGEGLSAPNGVAAPPDASGPDIPF